MGMIKSEREYVISKEKVKELKKVKSSKNIDKKLQEIANLGVESFCLQIEDEIKEYENIKKGKIPDYMKSFENLGLLLIALRIKKGWTQAQLAEVLKVAPSQVSRDENNEYFGTSMGNIKRILKALDYELTLKIR
jgi:hypothetical protein